MTHNTEHQNGFFGLGIAPNLLDILARLHFTEPTPIQSRAIPIGIQGKDMVGIAQTGTGKTLAFAIPLLQRLSSTKGRGLILLPTRELAIQVDETLQKLGRSIGLKTAVLIGGASMHMQISALRRNPHIIVATPGRLNDHLEQRTITLEKVNTLILDEADRMLDMGFLPQIKRILQTVPKERHTMLFSATMPAAITQIAASYMQLPVRIEIAPSGTAAERVVQEIYIVSKQDKLRLLEKLLNEYTGTILVFSRTKHGAKKIAHAIKNMGVRSSEIHSNRSLAQRREALEGFKSGKYRVLVATDIAARGIDVTNIEVVINFDLPDQSEDYVHRIGRTGRAGLEGRAISFAQPDQGRDVRDIERLVRTRIPIIKLPELPPARIQPQDFKYDMPSDRPRSHQRPYHGQDGGSPPRHGRGGSGPNRQGSSSRPYRRH